MGFVLRTFLERCVQKGTLNVVTARGETFDAGDGTGCPVAIHFIDRGAEHEILLDPAASLGELFADGRIVVTRGTVFDLLDLLGRNLKGMSPPGLGKLNERLRTALRPARLSNTARRSVRQISHHYDLDSRLYELFLDPDLQYSCAYFEYPGQTLEAAQRAKKRHIAAKLLVNPGARVLDIGSGWGGLALYLAEYCGASVTGVTLSEEQLGIARKRAAQGQLAARVEFRLSDYRDVEETFDRIVSVGMFEHVGPADYGTYFRTASRLLKDDGVMILHSIGRFDGVSATNPWIAKYIFPGGHLPALSEVLPEIEKSGLIVTDVEILRLHYAETLAAWRKAFLDRREDAARLLGETFCRMWEFYLAVSEIGFRYGNLMVFQIQLAKRLDAVPLTRNYIADREAALAERELAADEPAAAAE
jgi:cyclopropane-fatty-acyl-phospholipid synthase